MDDVVLVPKAMDAELNVETQLTIPLEKFDAMHLDALAEQANVAAEATDNLKSGAAFMACRCGHALNIAKAKVKQDGGKWLEWLECNFSKGQSTAKRYMKIATEYVIPLLAENRPRADEKSLPEGSVRECLKAMSAGDSPTTLVGKMTGNEEAYTPEDYIEAARDVMGDIDLDPASCEFAQQTVQAGAFFTKDDDGLSKDWHGNVWLNPPYTARVINEFVSKLCESHKSGTVPQAVLLTNNNTDTSWFHEALDVSQCVCLTRGRIGFNTPEGKVTCPTNGQALFYFGKRKAKFRDRFAEFGRVVHELT